MTRNPANTRPRSTGRSPMHRGKKAQIECARLELEEAARVCAAEYAATSVLGLHYPAIRRRLIDAVIAFARLSPKADTEGAGG
jgi:hypothetical protein